MKWKKLGYVFSADTIQKLDFTHARMPTQLYLQESIFRIYFEVRGLAGTAQPCYLDFDLEKRRVENLQLRSLLDYGPLGYFDDNGITPFSAHLMNDEVWLYYVGWNRMRDVPFRNAIGLAISRNKGSSFTKYSAGPILAQDQYDPIFPTGPMILYELGKWSVWYTSFEAWKDEGSSLKHYYNIKKRVSSDGINWHSKPQIAINFANEYEYAFVCRSVIRHLGLYKMWYSFRAGPVSLTYRIGYAESEDGEEWDRKDHLSGIDVSEDGWDSEMICYPRVFEHKGQLFMFYNGNGYGKTGFGLAVLEED